MTTDKGKLSEEQKVYRRDKLAATASDRIGRQQARQTAIAARQAEFNRLSPAQKEARQAGKAVGKYVK